ncbi:hypothetical protein LCGC14_1394370 [marine sediment metagenome]|uniref:Uncharacterized protein n=1 Tax=marine sediment metagenome TaxID=412755 RepID=A0A0F9KJU1_9ZZZZ
MKVKLIGIGRWGEFGTEYTFQVDPSETHNVTYIERVMKGDPEYARLDALKMFDVVEMTFAKGTRQNTPPASPPA